MYICIYIYIYIISVYAIGRIETHVVNWKQISFPELPGIGFSNGVPPQTKWVVVQTKTEVLLTGQKTILVSKTTTLQT